MAVETPAFNVAPYEQIVSKLRITPEQFASRARYLEIGGRNASQLEKFIKGKRNVQGIARSIIRNPNEFKTLARSEGRWFVLLANTELGLLDDFIMSDQLLGTETDVDSQGKPAPFTKGRGQELGLKLCLPETGIYQAAADQDQPLDDVYCIAMKPITASYGYPSIFGLGRDSDGLWLRDVWISPGPGRWWYPSARLVWALPQVASKPQHLR